MKKRFFVLALGLSLCSLTAYASNNQDTEISSNYNIASSSNATHIDVEYSSNVNDEVVEAIPDTNLSMEKATASDATPFGEDIFLSITETEDYSEILSLEDDMVARAQHLYELGEIKRPINSEDIDYEKAVKIFMDGEDSITNSPIITKEILRDYLEDREYIWELPINIGSQTISFTFNIGKSFDESWADLLTEEQQEEIIANEGHWIIARIAWNDIRVDDYKKYVNNCFANNQLNESETASVLIGGIPNVYQPVAIVLADDDSYVVPSCEATSRSMKTLVNSNQSESRQTYSTTDIFSYADFRELINQ